MALAFGIASPDASAAGAPAGTDIQNTAEVELHGGWRHHDRDCRTP